MRFEESPILWGKGKEFPPPLPEMAASEGEREVGVRVEEMESSRLS